MFLQMMRECVEQGLIDVDAAVDYLYGIHSEPEDEDDYLNESRLFDKTYVRAELSA
jgi:hypothetical protein